MMIQMNNLNLSGNSNTIQVLKNISNLIINGAKNKIFISAKVLNIVVNGNHNIINVKYLLNQCENRNGFVSNIVINGNNNKLIGPNIGNKSNNSFPNFSQNNTTQQNTNTYSNSTFTCNFTNSSNFTSNSSTSHQQNCKKILTQPSIFPIVLSKSSI